MRASEPQAGRRARPTEVPRPEAVTARRKEKKWTCADCGKAHKERSAVRGKGGGYVCLEGCGLMEGRRAHKRQRPLEAGS